MAHVPVDEGIRERGPLQVKKSWSFHARTEGNRLLDRFRLSLSPCRPDEALRNMRSLIKFIKDKHIQGIQSDRKALLASGRKRIQADQKATSASGRTRIQADPEAILAFERKQIRKAWRKDRIDLYDDLILIILAEKDNWKDWCDLGNKTLVAKWTRVFRTKFEEPGSIYKLLLDYIHEHDDVAMKFYLVRDSNKLHRDILNPKVNEEYFWFFQSMERYRVQLIGPVLDIMINPKSTSQQKLEDATVAFDRMVEDSGKQGSWRYRARMYWLLSRYQHASFGANYMCKTSDYIGPIGDLCQMIIDRERRHMLFDEATKVADPKLDYPSKFDQDRPDWTVADTLLLNACAQNDLGLVKCMLRSKTEFESHPDYDFKLENCWKIIWAKALWIAAYKGHEAIVKELLQDCSKLYSTKFYSDKESPQPLHEAVRKGHVSVVGVFCAVGPKSIMSCHEVDKFSGGYTPLELATKNLKDDPDKKKRIQSILLTAPEVDRAVQDQQLHRELTVSSANAMMVGAALIAGVTYAGWLQPPLGYQTYYQLTEPAPDDPLKYIFVQGLATIRVFAIFNALSFFFAIAAIISGMETACYIGHLEEMYIRSTVENLRHKLKRTRILFIIGVIFVLVAFSSAAIAVLPPVTRYHTDMYVTIAFGGFFCMAMMFLFTISKRRAFIMVKKHLGCMFTNIKEKLFGDHNCFGVRFDTIKYYLEEDISFS